MEKKSDDREHLLNSLTEGVVIFSESTGGTLFQNDAARKCLLLPKDFKYVTEQFSDSQDEAAKQLEHSSDKSVMNIAPPQGQSIYLNDSKASLK